MLTSGLLALLLGSSAIRRTLAGAAFQTHHTFLRSSNAVVRRTAPQARCSSAPRKALRCNIKKGEDASLGRLEVSDRENLVCNVDVRSSRLEFFGSVAAGLGATTRAAAAAQGAVTTASFDGATRSVEEVKKAIEADFLSRQYYVTGDLTPSLYRPDCFFTDPTTRVASVDRYVAAVKLLFDPDNAQVDLLSLKVKDDTHIFAEWRLQGYLKFPWHPYVKPYTGTTLYTLDSEGFITSHQETWSITALDAARATITPTAGPQAARSTEKASL